MTGRGPNCLKRSVLNVCVANTVKSLTCDHPSTDGYEVENLISTNLSQRRKGFLAERFIRPPVILTFEFKCVIDIKYIFIHCEVGSAKTSGVELSIQPDSKENQFESVSSGVLKENQRGFVFHHRSENVKPKFGDEFYFRSFKLSNNLSAVKRVRLKIFRTKGCSIPALGKVEVWGVPNKPIPEVPNNVIGPKNMAQKCLLEEKNELKSLMLERSSRTRTSFPSGLSQSVEVPEEFIDPITCVIMCQPVTLPSGKVIDTSTLESFEKAESEWGRGPSDPFTGVPFTSNSKPIAAIDLKLRIDKFLCDNGNNPKFFEIPRTVGKSLASSHKKTVKPCASKLITNERHMPISSCSAIKDPSSDDDNGDCDKSVRPKRRKVEETRDQVECRTNSDLKRKEVVPVSKNNSTRTSSIYSLKKSANRLLSFQERMEKSLELSLKSTLSSFPSFTDDDKQCSEKSLVECVICKSRENLFSIPCSHFVCRNCLVMLKAKGSLSCSFCKSSFDSHGVHKVHVG